MSKEKIKKECEQCGKIFFSKSDHAKYCSGACLQRHYRKTRLSLKNCNYCGKEFVQKYKGSVYCSAECRNKSRHEKIKEFYELQKSQVKKTKKCELCGEEFVPTNGCQKYCKNPECVKNYKRLKDYKKTHGEEAARIKKRMLKKKKFSFVGNSPADYGRQQIAETQLLSDMELNENYKKWLEERKKNEGKTRK